MDAGLSALLLSAASIAFIHTLVGVDHVIPFVMLSRAEGWSAKKTALVTALCGVGHVASSVILGLAGIATGAALESLLGIEALRGRLALFCLVGFGLAYAAIAAVKAIRNKSHAHLHVHDDGTIHHHSHAHDVEHSHLHEALTPMTPWVLFILFAFGPCEALIPLMLAPAALFDAAAIFAVVSVFGIVTIATMVCLVLVALRGLSLTPSLFVERWAHVGAGLVIAATGGLVAILGV